MTDKERRDKRFRKLCKWMSEADDKGENEQKSKKGNEG